MTRKKQTEIMAALLAAAASVVAPAATVTLAPPSGTTTNVLALYTGATSVEIAGPGTVSLNPANSYTGGTTLSGGTLAYSGTPRDGASPLGTGALSITSADAVISGSGTIANDISAAVNATFSPEEKITLSGDNVFSALTDVTRNTLEIAGGETSITGGLYLCYTSAGTAHFRQTGGSVQMASGNVHLGYYKGATTSFTMTGGSFDVNGGNLLLYGNYGNAATTATADISGDAQLRNIASLYVHNKYASYPDTSFSATIHDGGTLGFQMARHNKTSCIPNVNLYVDGGTLANDNASAGRSTERDWISNLGVASFKVGPNGATFTTKNGANAGTAKIGVPIAAEAAGAGETAKGLTFDNGYWEFAAAGNAYEGPTAIRNGSMLFLDANGTIPSGSTVTVGSGSELCTGGGNKTVTDLVLERDATLGFGTSSSIPYTLTVTGSLTLPARAKIALYSANTPTTSALTAVGTYAVLQVPAEYAAALAAVNWSCATTSSGNTYSFSVSTAGDTATLSMTIADKPASGTDFTIAAGEEYALGDTTVGSETITVNGYLFIDGYLAGNDAGGKLIVGNGGVLDVTGTIKPQSTGATFDFYLNAGASLFVRTLQSSETFDTNHPLRFDGGTVYPIASTTPSTTVTYPARYSSVLVSGGGVTYDLSHWLDDGRDREEGWYRFNLTARFDHDASGPATDGGITVCGTPGEPVLINFGSGFVGSTMNGGVTVEEGGGIVAGSASALANQSVTLLPGSLFRQYSNTLYTQMDSLTFGRAGATAPVQFQMVANKNNPAIIVESLDVLSPVEVSFISGWKYDAVVAANTRVMAAVFKAGSSSVDTSLFQLPASATTYSLSVETEELAEGTYAGYTALYITVTGEDPVPDNLELKTDGTNVTLSADATYNNIYVGDIEGAGTKSLTVAGGEISAQILHIASSPVDDEKHTCYYTQSGGKVSVNRLASMYRGENTARGRVNAEITLNGGTLEVADYVRFGFNRTRAGYTTILTINDGAAMTVGGKMWLTYYSGTGGSVSPQGIINMNGGTLSVANDIDLSRADHSTIYKKDGGIFLRGGVISARNIMQEADPLDTQPQRLVFDGGVYAPNADAAGLTLEGLSKAHIAAGGAIVDTSALAADATYTIAQNILHDPALTNSMGEVVADGGFTKRGTGTLALTGANTFTGPTRVEGGILAITGGDAVSSDIAVSDGAVLDLGGASVSVGKIAASGLVRNGSLSVTNAIAVDDEGSMLAVDGNLAFAADSAVDFGGCAEVPTGWIPIAAAGGTVTLPEKLRVRNARGFNSCTVRLADGVVFVKLGNVGMFISFR